MFTLPLNRADVPPARQQKTTGFTLVELLIAISVIAILVGILVPSVFAVMNRARETSITTETNQIAQAIERFKTDHGFYPPTIGPAGGGYAVESSADMLRFLNRLSRNHAEGNGAAGTRLAIWWAEVGSNLDERSSLVFWLSGVFKNKQFPLTGASANDTAAEMPAPYNVNQFIGGGDFPTGLDLERDEYYGFKIQQRFPTSSTLNIAGYNQAYGPSDSGDLSYRYLDHRSYPVGAYAATATTYINPKSFQLVSPGMDGQIVGTGDPTPLVFSNPAIGFQHDDNIVNFAQGRFDKYVNDNN
ncbi:MAG: type II secretion system protein [Planctomycetota bacterium]